MSEPRCGLIHMRSGRALAKVSRGDCDAALSDFSLSDQTRRKLRRSAYEFKLQVAKANEDGQPELLWVRIGAHPQRCLCASEGSRVRLERWLSPAAPEPQWRVHFLEAQESNTKGEAFPALCFLQNVKTGMFLSMEDGVPSLCAQGDLWGILQLRSAMTPGKVLRRSALVGGGGVAIASVGAVGVVGASAMGATVRGATAASAAGTAVSTATSAVGTAATAASGLTLAKAAAALAALPAAVASVVTAGTTATAAVGAVGATVPYALVGAGCGVAMGAVGAAASATAALVSSARDPGLYVHGYPFLPAQLNRSASRLSTLSQESKEMTSSMPMSMCSASELAHSESEMSLEADD